MLCFWEASGSDAKVEVAVNGFDEKSKKAHARDTLAGLEAGSEPLMHAVV